GVRTVVIPDEAVKDTDQLINQLERQRVTRIVLVPSLLRVLLQNNPDLKTRLPQLRTWITSGEELTPELKNRFETQMTGRRLLNFYGSTEVAADVTYHEVGSQASSVSRVPIGRPIANTQVYIFDGSLLPVPRGVPGQLFVGGAGLARGYLAQP